MCGVSGYSTLPHAKGRAVALHAACAALAHRGPDDCGVFEDPTHGVGLAHTRLSILDLSPLGHQPMLSPDGRVALVFNGEIYNFRELRTELEAEGHAFKGHSDTEVLLHLYLSWRQRGGELAALLRRLNGIFAFAIWDADRTALLLVRDALGVKPLYYRADGGSFAFASEIKALLPLTGALEPLDPGALHRYLTFLWCPGEGTPARAVRKLSPGEFIWIREGQITERSRWYRLPVFRSVPATLGQQASIRGTEQRLRTAVHRQMVADVPVGAFLSGGLDSSSVVAFAREINPDIRCFTIDMAGGSEAGSTDDLPYAKQVAKHLSVQLEVVRIDSAQMAADLEHMVTQLDEPLADPAPLNVLYISRLARERGMKVLLSGSGGDDLFTGYRRHRAVAAERLWKWLPAPMRAGLHRATRLLDQRSAWARRLSKAFDGAALDGDARLVNYFRWVRREDLTALYSAEFRSAVGTAEAAAPMLDFLAELSPSVAPLDRMLALEQRFFLADHNLIYTDKMSMAAGIEVRVPFLDLDLVEFAHRIPLRFKQRGSEGKWVLKKAMEPHLPQEVIYRPKSGFGAPLRRWMRVELREWLAAVLGEASLRHRGLFDPAAVQKLIRANDEGTVDASYTLLSLVCVELWCRSFIDKHTTDPPRVMPQTS
jgi:asparagine synthase (glutamine-hydrolysing)